MSEDNSYAQKLQKPNNLQDFQGSAMNHQKQELNKNVYSTQAQYNKKQIQQQQRSLATREEIEGEIASEEAREAIAKWKFGQIVQNMLLEQINETNSEDNKSSNHNSDFEDFNSQDILSEQKFNLGNRIYSNSPNRVNEILLQKKNNFRFLKCNQDYKSIPQILQKNSLINLNKIKDLKQNQGIFKMHELSKNDQNQSIQLNPLLNKIATNQCEDQELKNSQENNKTLFLRIWQEIRHSINRLFNFFLVNIVIVGIKMMECSWLIGLTLVARGMRWQLHILKYILQCLITGIFCVGFVSCFCCKKKVISNPLNENQSAQSQSNVLTQKSKEEIENELEISNQPLLIIINLENALIYASKIKPEFFLQKPALNSQQSSIPFRIEIKENVYEIINSNQQQVFTQLYIHTRPWLPLFLKSLQEMGPNVEVAIYSSKSKQFVEEVLKWIDPKNQCQWRFDSSQLNSNNQLTGIVQNGKLLRDVETIYRKICTIRQNQIQSKRKLSRSPDIDQETKKLQNVEKYSDEYDFQSIDTDKSELGQEDQSSSEYQQNEPRDGFKESKKLIEVISTKCDKIEDEIRGHPLMQDIIHSENLIEKSSKQESAFRDLLKDKRYLNKLKIPILRRVIMIDDIDKKEQSNSSFYMKNLISIKPWKNDNHRDHVLKDCLAIIRQMLHSKNVNKDLPQFVEFYNQIIDQ